MKKCPHCGELLGDDVRKCFKCHFDYSYGRVLTSEERRAVRQKEEQEVQESLQYKADLARSREEQIRNNALYEYDTVIVNDSPDGTIDEAILQRVLNDHARQGWQLHSVFTNEVGKNVTSTSSSFLAVGSNATIEQTILIFERCIRKGM